MKNLIIFVATSMFISSCMDKKFEITTEYIVNPSWTKQGEKVGSNAIEIKAMKVKEDSTLNPFEELTQGELVGKLHYDTSFSYFANVRIKSDENYKDTKVYFNKENEFYWLGDQFGNIKTKTIGKLEANRWYEISKISYISYFVYIDSLEKVHLYNINQANY